MSPRKTKYAKPGPNEMFSFRDRIVESIQQTWPEVVKIEFHGKYYTDENSLIHDNPIIERWLPNRSANFWLKCLGHECTEGGHDLNPKVDEMIKNRIQTSKFKHLCQGWQDPERIGKHRCYRKVMGTLNIQYLEIKAATELF